MIWTRLKVAWEIYKLAKVAAPEIVKLVKEIKEKINEAKK